MNSDVLSRSAIHQALKTWHNTRRLGELALAQIPLIENHCQKNNYQFTSTGRGLGLRETLQRALDMLKPEGVLDPLEKRWRPYLILTERYLNGRSPEYLIEWLGIARSTFDHTQTEALDAIVDILHEWAEAMIVTLESVPSSVSASFVSAAPFLAPPPPSYALIGRDTLYTNLKMNLLAGHPSLLALCGLPGVGKTALTIALAHDPDLRTHFEDGVLWAGLGKHPNLLALLGGWGTSLGLSQDELSKLSDLDTRARAIHAAIGLRRMLLVIDDAWNNGDALAFKLGGPNCAMLLTTRLPKVALDFAGDHTYFIPELSEKEGTSLLAEFAPQILTEPDAALALVRAVGGLPLALTLMGRYLRQETHAGPPRRLLAALERLQTTETRLRLTQPASPLDHQPSLSAELPLSLLTVISISTETLDEAAHQAFYALAFFPPKPNTFSEEAAIAVCSAVTPAPLIGLDTLADVGLIEFTPPDRYTLHPIITEFARLELSEHPAIERLVAERLVRHFLLTLPEATALELEAENVLAALNYAYLYRLDEELLRGAPAFCAYLEAHGLYSLAEQHLTRAEGIARSRFPSEDLLPTLNNLGRIAQRQGDYPLAEARYQEALNLSKIEPISSLRSAILQGLGLVALSRGDFSQAGQFLHESLALARAMGDSAVASAVLSNLGALSFNQGDYVKAGQLFEEGLKQARIAGLQQQSNALLTNLGVLAARRGDLDQAQAFFEEALELARQMGHRSHTSYLLTNLGTLASERGEQAAATAYFQEGLKLARDIGQRDRIGHLLANLGALATHDSNYSLAQVYLDESRAISEEMGHRQNIILALTNLSGLAIAKGDYIGAFPLLEEAMSLARETGQVGYISSLWLEYGRYYAQQARYPEATQAYQEGLELARKMGALAGVGRALFGLAQLAALIGEKDKASEFAQESLRTYQKIGHYRHKDVEAWLQEMDRQGVLPLDFVDEF